MKVWNISNDFADQLSFDWLPNVVFDFGRVVVVIDRVNEVNTKKNVRFNKLHAGIQFSERFQSLFDEVILAFL
jgi:hypothetical protein